MTIAIIGTAGRKEDGDKLSLDLYNRMYYDVIWRFSEMNVSVEERHLVSGGAAWADHLAVRAFLEDECVSLSLHLPAMFGGCRYLGMNSSKYDPGRIANYYHGLFSNKVKTNTLLEIAAAIKKGAGLTVSKGFKERNLLVGKSDAVLAYTFGQESFPKDGGTLHTWNSSSAKIKTHIPLHELRAKL